MTLLKEFEDAQIKSEMNASFNLEHEDMELGLTNNQSKIAKLVLKLFFMFYDDINYEINSQQYKQLYNLGPLVQTMTMLIRIQSNNQ